MSENTIFSNKFKIYLTSVVLATTFLWTMRSVVQKRRLKMKKQALKLKSNIQSDTIIVAFEPEQLFVKMKKQPQGQMKMLKSSSKSLVGKICSVFQHAQGYQQKISGKNLRKLIKDMLSLQNVRLMIYTRLPKQTCEQILDNFGVSTYFEHKNRIYMQNDHKSADQLDCDTGRVIIISALKDDQKYCMMGNDHNLILDLKDEQKLEGQLYDKLKQFLKRTIEQGRADNLHEDMHHLALQLQLPIWNDEH